MSHDESIAKTTGEIPPTRGAAFLGGYDVCKDPEAIHRLVGYCPQFDALFETLTGREHLKLYGAIKVTKACTACVLPLCLGRYLCRVEFPVFLTTRRINRDAVASLSKSAEMRQVLHRHRLNFLLEL